MGLKGNLTAGEIIEQLVHALRVTPVRNVVFMVSLKHLLLVADVSAPQCMFLWMFISF